jgi:hypothetical protein
MLKRRVANAGSVLVFAKVNFVSMTQRGRYALGPLESAPGDLADAAFPARVV